MASTVSTKKVLRNKITSYTGYHPTWGLTVGSYIETFDGPLTVFSKNKTWVRTPSYRALVAAGSILPDNSFNFTTFDLPVFSSTFVPPLVDGGDRWTQYDYRYTGSSGVGVTLPTSEPDFSVVNSKLIGKAKGNQWNVPVFVAEGRKTMQMVAQAAERMVLMARALKRGQWGDFVKYSHPSNRTRLQNRTLRTKFGKAYARNPREAAANYWLEFRYGWLPFMVDVHNAVDTLMDTAERPDSLESSVSATHKPTVRTTISTDVRTFADGTNCQVFATIEAQEIESYRATWRYSMRAGDVPGRFGLLNPLEVVWELVPLSFVVDWFLPVNYYLSALDAPFRFTHIGGTRGYRYSSRTTYQPTRTLPPNRPFTGFAGTGSYTTLFRSPMTAMPSVEISVIKLDFAPSAIRLTSAMALLSQTFKSK